MKKSALFLIFITILSLKLSASLLDIYKSGKLKLVPDPNFGKGTAWDIYFPQGILDIAFAEDGSFFATGNGHCVYKFDKNGEFIKKFGRKGRGPGDLYHPNSLSILDNKYLLVTEYALIRRISVFDLNGNFVKIIRTKEMPFDVVALSNKRFLVLLGRNESNNKKSVVIYYDIILKELDSKKEKKILTFSYIKPKGSVGINFSIFMKNVYLIRIDSKSFICGFSGEPYIHFLSMDGKELRRVKVDTKRVRLTGDIAEVFYKYVEKKMRKIQGGVEYLKKQYKEGLLIPEYTPYFMNLSLDPVGNVLVFENSRKYKYNKENGDIELEKILRFKIYNTKGKYLGDRSIDFEKINKTDFFIPKWFHNQYLYYETHNKDNEFSLKRTKLM